MRIGVFLPNWIGDAVMATPAIRSLRGLAGENGSLVAIGKPHIRDVLGGLDWFRGSVDYLRKDPTNDFCNKIREQRLDMIVLFPNSLRTGWLAWRAGIDQRVGYHRFLRGPLLTTVLREPRSGGKRISVPTIDHYLMLAYAAGGNNQPPRLELATTADDELAADRAWEELGLPEGDRVVVFNSGGAFGASKRWPDEHFAVLAQRIHDQLGLAVLVNCGPAEEDLARNIVRLADRPSVVSLAGRDLPVGLSKAVIRRARMLVSTDSGPRFFGVAFEKPVVTVFGPTDPRHSLTHYDGERSLSLSLDCQPCWESTCPLKHHKCMRDLSVDRVFNEVQSLLTEQESDTGRGDGSRSAA